MRDRRDKKARDMGDMGDRGDKENVAEWRSGRVDDAKCRRVNAGRRVHRLID
jgi:hypothetical protein